MPITICYRWWLPIACFVQNQEIFHLQRYIHREPPRLHFCLINNINNESKLLIVVGDWSTDCFSPKVHWKLRNVSLVRDDPDADADKYKDVHLHSYISVKSLLYSRWEFWLFGESCLAAAINAEGRGSIARLLKSFIPTALLVQTWSLISALWWSVVSVWLYVTHYLLMSLSALLHINKTTSANSSLAQGMLVNTQKLYVDTWTN